MTKTMKVNGGKVEMTFIPNEVKELSIDQKISKLRYDILSLETQLLRMQQKKETFSFGTKKYNDMVEHIKWGLNDLSSFESRVKQIRANK